MKVLDIIINILRGKVYFFDEKCGNCGKEHIISGAHHQEKGWLCINCEKELNK